MKRWIAIGVLMWIAAGCTRAPLAATDLLRVGHADGLTMSLWDGAPRIDVSAGPIGEDGGDLAARFETTAQLAADAENLYVCFQSVGPTPVSPFTKRDDLLHQADVLEVFLDVGGRGQRIVEVQVNPAGVTADYLHVWDQRATYPPDAIDVPFYRANHHADIHFDVVGLQAASQVIPLSEGRARWIAMLTIPLRQALEAEGLKPTLQPGQSIRLNLLRYAWSESNGQRNFRQFSLVPVKHGCPHQSPTAMKTFTLTR